MVSSRRAPNSPIHCTKENTRAPPPRRMYTLSFKSFEEVEKLRMKMFPRIIQRDDIGKNYYLSDLELFFNDRKNPRLLFTSNSYYNNKYFYNSSAFQSEKRKSLNTFLHTRKPGTKLLNGSVHLSTRETKTRVYTSKCTQVRNAAKDRDTRKNFFPRGTHEKGVLHGQTAIGQGS